MKIFSVLGLFLRRVRNFGTAHFLISISKAISYRRPALIVEGYFLRLLVGGVWDPSLLAGIMDLC